MATTVIKTCDKCGEKLTYAWGEMDVSYSVEPPPVIWRFSLWNRRHNKYELCPECGKQLLDWFKKEA